MRETFRRLDTQERVLLWVLIVVMLAFFVSGSLQGQAPVPCVTEMPADLWPPNPCPKKFHGDDAVIREGPLAGEIALEAALAGTPKPFDMGALRKNSESGCIEITFGGTDWINYNPRDSGHVLWSNYFSRYGRGISRGHGHGIDSEVCAPVEYYRVARGITGLTCESMEVIDTWWCDGLLKQLQREYAAKIGPPVLCPNRACDPGESNETCPQDCKPGQGVPGPQKPPDPTLDPLCWPTSVLCDGKCSGPTDRCPCDCQEDPSVPEPAGGGPCSVVEVALADAKLRIIELLKPKPKPPLSSELAAMLQEERARSGRLFFGACARYNKIYREVCATHACPSTLTPLTCRR